MSNNRDLLLKVDNLAVTAETNNGTFEAVRKVDFEIKQSESVALVGESGSGKSLTALSIAGLLGPSLSASGSITFQGSELIGLSEKQQRQYSGKKIGFIFQEPMSSLHPILTVGQQLEEGLRAHTDLSARGRRARVLELLETVGLAASRSIIDDRIGQLSGGMRQRVMIAMAISCEPEILIADEPTTALDVTLQKQIIELLLSLRESLGLSLLLITHDLGVVSETCEQAVVMFAGEVVERGPVSKVLSSPLHAYTQALLASIPRLGDDRERLPTVSSIAPWLRDRRGERGVSDAPQELVQPVDGHWVRHEDQEVSA